MPAPLPVAILGFDTATRQALVSVLERSQRRTPAYRLVLSVDDARFVIADGAQAEAVNLLFKLGRTPDAVFLGQQAPEGAAALLPGPVDPTRVLHQLDTLLARQDGIGLSGAAPSQATAILAHHPSPWHQARDAARRKREAQRRSRPAPRVLLVDDSEIALHYLQRQLHRYGLQVDLARSSEHALMLLQREVYGLAFLDLDLGADSRMDGFELCRVIRHRLPQSGVMAPTVVMVSAFNDPVHQVRGALSGAEASLGKPLDTLALAQLMQRQGLSPVAPAGQAQAV